MQPHPVDIVGIPALFYTFYCPGKTLVRGMRR